MITITKPALDKVKKNIEKRGRGIGLRVGVRTTGCSGLAYTLEYADEIRLEDKVFKVDDNIVILSDFKDYQYLLGTEIDYVRQGLNEGFEFRNPQERDRCGCGESFRI